MANKIQDNIDDLFVDTEMDSKSKKQQKTLLLLVVTVIMFVIVLIIYYLLTKTEAPPVVQAPVVNIVPEVNDTNIIAPPLENNFTMPNMDVNNTDVDEKFNNIVNNIKAKNPPAIEPEVKKPVKAKETPKEAPKVVKQTPKQEVKPKAEAKKDSITPKVYGGEATTGFYTQVGSFTGVPNKVLFDVLKNNKLGYRVLVDNGITKVLVGPYNTKQDALSELEMIRKDVLKEAFVKEVK